MRPSNDGGSVCSQQPHMIDKRKVWCTAHVKSVAWHDDTRKMINIVIFLFHTAQLWLCLSLA